MSQTFSHVTIIYKDNKQNYSGKVRHRFDETNFPILDEITNNVKDILVYKKDLYGNYYVMSFFDHFIKNTSNYERIPVEYKTRPINEYILQVWGSEVFPKATHHDVDIGEVYAVDMIYWDFKPMPVKMDIHPTIPIPNEDKTDYLLQKEEVDYEHLAKTSLVTVNGFAHRLWYGDEGLYIQDAYQTAKRVQGLHISLMCFEEIGEVEYIDITKENLINPIEDLDWRKAFYLHFPNTDLSQDEIAISIAGHLHFIDGQDKVLRRVSENVLKIDMRYFNLYHRIWNIDILMKNGLKEYEVTEEGRPVIFTEPLKQKVFLEAILDMSQTFLVRLKTDYPIHYRRDTIGRLTWPKRYTFKNKQFFHYPLRLGDGRFPACHFIDERIGYVVNTIDNTKKYLFDDLANREELPFLTYYERTTTDPEIQHGCFYIMTSAKHVKIEE